MLSGKQATPCVHMAKLFKWVCWGPRVEEEGWAENGLSTTNFLRISMLTPVCHCRLSFWQHKNRRTEKHPLKLYGTELTECSPKSAPLIDVHWLFLPDLPCSIWMNQETVSTVFHGFECPLMLQGICSQVAIQPVCFPLSFNNFLMEAVSSLFCPAISYFIILPHFLVLNCCKDLISDPFHVNGCLQQSVFPSPCLESSWQGHLQSVHPEM